RQPTVRSQNFSLWQSVVAEAVARQAAEIETRAPEAASVGAAIGAQVMRGMDAHAERRNARMQRQEGDETAKAPAHSFFAALWSMLIYTVARVASKLPFAV